MVIEYQVVETVLTLPKIGITGSFGRGNVGDELFVRAHQNYFRDQAELFLVTQLPHQHYFSEFANTLIDSLDGIAIGGGDLICPYREKMDQDFSNPKYLRKPVHMVGIGVENNKDEEIERTMEVWKNFLNHSNMKSITVRDPASQKWLKKKMFKRLLGSRKVPCHPDIALSLTLPEVEKPEDRPILGIVTRSITHPKDMLEAKNAALYLQSQGWRVRHIIFGVGRHGSEEHEKSHRLELDEKETIYTQDIDTVLRAVGECSLVLSMKLHSSIVATMYDVPCVVLSRSIKMKQFMQAINRPDFCISPDNDQLVDMIKDGIPAVDTDHVNGMKKEATSAMQSFVKRVLSTA